MADVDNNSNPKAEAQSAPLVDAAPARKPRSQLAAFLVMFKTFYLIVLLSLTQHASQRALHPLYGSTTTSQNYEMLFAFAMSASLVFHTKPSLEWRLWGFLATVLCAAPYTGHHFGAWTARWGDSFWGPILAQLPMTVPVAILSNLIIRINFVSCVENPPILRSYFPLVSSNLQVLRTITGWRGLPCSSRARLGSTCRRPLYGTLYQGSHRTHLIQAVAW